MRMHANDARYSYVQAFKMRARMVPAGSGGNVLTTWPRHWTTLNQPLTLTGAHNLVVQVVAPIADTQKDWDLQVELYWDRMSKPDWSSKLTIKNFNTSGCPGGMSSAAPAGPQAE